MKTSRVLAAFVGAIALIVAFALMVSGNLFLSFPNSVSTGASAMQVQGELQVPAAAGKMAGNPTATAMVRTQRMSDATLKSTQNGWYEKGQKLVLTCFKRGQSVQGYFSPYITGGWDNLWYKVSDGFFVADVDIETRSNNPVTGECSNPPPPAPAPAPAPAAASIDTNQWYNITNRNSGLRVDLRGGSSSNGTLLQQYSANTSNAQKFRFIATSDGFYEVVSALSATQAWDVNNAGTGNGTKVHIWKYGKGNNQQWRVGATGSYVTFSPRHATSRCLDVPGASKAKSQPLQIYACNSTAAQQFTLIPLGYVVAPPAGRYQVPFATGQTWYVCQGYNGKPSHKNDIAFDITFESRRGADGCYGDASASSGKPVYAPISGKLAAVSSNVGGVCITPSGGGSIYLGHLTGIRGNGWVDAGVEIGKVAAPGVAGNNGYSHVHLSARSGTECGGNKVPFDTANKSRIIGVADLPSSGAANQWAGTTLRR